MDNYKYAVQNDRVPIKRIDFEKQVVLRELAEELDIKFPTLYSVTRLHKVTVYDFYGVIVVDREEFMSVMKSRRPRSPNGTRKSYKRKD